jgi:CubicO group peptidase (beta-lactamase class C family)
MRLAVLAALAPLLIHGPALAQQAPPPASLTLGKPVEREIGPGEVHVYTMRLDPNAFVRAVVDQRGIDVIVRVVGPDGARVAEVDSPNGAWGPEPVRIETASGGVYRVEVRPFDPAPKPGRYEATLTTMRPLATTTEGRLEQVLDEWSRPDAPGVAVSVVRDGQVVSARGLGAANLEYDVPITPSTVFHVASVSKQFTAFAVMLLARDGKLSLDDDVRKYLPEVPDFGRTITIRHLLTHTSGLYDQWEALMMSGWRLDDVITKDHILQVVSHERRLNFDPGSEHLYCNTGYTLAAEIVARVSGKPFREFTREAIFAPLGMEHTHFHDDHELVVKNRAYSYHTAPGGFRLSALNYANVGATSLFTTAEDLAKWLDNFRTAKVGGPAVLAEMTKPYVLTGGKQIDYALGLAIGSYRGLRTISHGGSDAGYRSYVVWFPDAAVGIAVLSNSASTDPAAIANRVADVYLDGRFKPTPPAAPRPAPVAVAPERLAGYAGTYRLGRSRLVTVVLENGALAARMPDAPPVTLEPRSETTFVALPIGTEIAFERDASGRATALTVGPQRAPRVDRVSPSPAELAEYAGVYYSEELGAAYTVSVDGDHLVATHRRTGPVTLSPTVRDEFVGDRGYFGGVAFVRGDDGRIGGLEVNAGRVRGVRFARVATSP